MTVSGIESSLIDTLKQSDLTDVAADAAELALDQIIDEGLLQNVPVVSTLTRLVKTGVTVRDYFFTKKLLKFLHGLSYIPKADRQQMVEQLEADPSYRQRVGESIITLLERLDDMEKPELIVRAFKAYSKGEIDSVQLQRFNYAIDRLLMCDLPKLPEFSKIKPTDTYPDLVAAQNFLNAGLAYVGTGWGAGGVAPNDICKPFVNHILGA